MNYHLRSDRKFRKIWLIPVIIIAIILFLIISSPLQRALGGTLNYLSYPFWKAKATFSNRVSHGEALWRSRLSLVEDNKALRKELARLELNLETLPFLEEENKNLKALLDRGALHENLPALVLARPPQTFYDVLIIDVGKNSGLEGGEIVYFESIVLGEVEEVNAKTSKVRLYSSSGVETEAFVERIDLPVLVTGRGGGNFKARLPQESPIEEGDFLTIVGNPNRLLGQVEAIEANPKDSFKRILLRYPVNLSEIQWLAVEIKK
jgi:rod shape-determining protein MreC